jgi:hypothetical protein
VQVTQTSKEKKGYSMDVDGDIFDKSDREQEAEPNQVRYRSVIVHLCSALQWTTCQYVHPHRSRGHKKLEGKL